ncbi:MAG: ribosome biogenesis GTP-binding protein YihA/YsxC [Nitrospiraceae bacterium]
MKILTAEFLRSCVKPEDFPKDRMPEVAFVGRSNVGKSSLINSLLNRKSLAKVSRTPGKTRAVNFFHVATADPSLKHFYLVDLPGYGYAKASKSAIAEWGPMIERYITSRPELRAVCLLLESRGIEDRDLATYAWLCDHVMRPVLVLTKSDKLTRSERGASLAAVRETFRLSEADRCVPYSSVTHDGRDELRQAIRTLLSA